MKFKLFLLLLLLPLVLKANLEKFPLFRIGIKINKPSSYFLLTPETVNLIKREISGIVNVCEASRVSIEKALSHSGFQMLLNENNYNELTSFVIFPRFNVNPEISQSLKIKLKEECYSFLNTSLEYIGDNSGTSPFGNYISFLYKVTLPNISYFSEGFFIEGKNSTILVTINTLNRQNNISFIKSIENINSEAYNIYLKEFEILMSSGNEREALVKLTKAIKFEPSNVDAYEKRIKINIKNKNYDEALKDVSIILKFEKTNINGILLKGIIDYYNRRYIEAIDNFNKAYMSLSILTSLNLQNEYLYSLADIYRRKGEAYLILKNSEKAMENFESGLELSYDSLNTASIYYNMGNVKATLQNIPSEAVKYYSKAIINYPSKANREKSEAYYNRALNFRKNGKIIEAIKDYDSAIKLRPNYSKAYNNRAVAKMKIEDFKGAIEDCNITLKLNNGLSEQTSMAYYNRGIAKLSLEDIKGCNDIKIAKSMGYSVPETILNICE